MIKFTKILAIAPHTDDVELACGGSLAKFIDEGKQIYVVVFSTAEQSLPKDKPKDILKIEFKNAMKLMGIPERNLIIFNYRVRYLSNYRQDVLEDLVKLRKKIDPDLVLLPSGNDTHQDHHVLFDEGLRAFKEKSIIGYELPWNHITFTSQLFITLEEKYIKKKWEILQQYKSQIEMKRPYFNYENLKSLAKVRGLQIKSEYAEAFEVYRIKY